LGLLPGQVKFDQEQSITVECDVHMGNMEENELGILIVTIGSFAIDINH